jgi:site-specific DNA recombinase
MSAVEVSPLRAGIYLRISSDDRRDELGVKRQLYNCERVVGERGAVVVGIYEDNDTSASKVHKASLTPLERPEFARLMSDVRRGALDVIVVQNQDRISRLTDELELTMRQLRAAGHVEFWTASAGAQRIDSSTGRMTYRMKGVMDSMYAEYIGEKVMEKKDELARLGLPSGGGTRPFGYRKGGMELDEDEAVLVREAVGRVLEGETIYAITRSWQERGVPTVSGKPWVPNTLQHLLSAPRIAGLREHRGAVVGKAAWPAIVDEVTWERVRSALEVRSPRGATVPRRLLTGLVRCGICGDPLYGGRNNGKRSYDCRPAPQFSGCGRIRIAAEPLEELVVAAVLERFDEAAIPIPRAEAGPDETVEELEVQLAALAEEFSRGDLEQGEWRALRVGIKARLDEVRRHVRVATATRNEAQFLGKFHEPGSLRRVWNRPDGSGGLAHDERRAVLAAVIDQIAIAPAVRGRNRFDPERAAITWKA